MKSIYVTLVLLFGALPTLATFNPIKKIFAHPITQTSDMLEVGNIIFYFDKEQVVNMLKQSTKGDRQQRVYFFPMAQISSGSEMEKMVHDLCALKHPWYSCSLVSTKKPISGVQLIIDYDPQAVEITFNSFRSLNLKQGVIFRFCNKKVLHQLQEHQKNASIVQTVMHAAQPTVVIDCGHGGEDEGAVYHNVKEKDINLQVGLLVADLLKKKGVCALLTRSNDATVSLKDRIVQANNAQATLFVSLHSNAALNNAASGIETFGMVPLLVHTDWGENGSQHVAHQVAHARIDKSMLLAQAIHTTLLAHARKINPTVKDRFVKRAPLLVLAGTTMPSALVELGFVSNQEEVSLLSNKNYQKCLALGVSNGICSYLENRA
jgi:N-acetylmuramoyl-L-alanine amidase